MPISFTAYYGIQITRSGGEGALVNIRGNGNSHNLLNGEQMLSAR